MAKYKLDWVKIVHFSLIASYFSGWTFFWIWSQCEMGNYKTNSKSHFLTKNWRLHSVKIEQFSYNPYFTWNQFCKNWKPQGNQATILETCWRLQSRIAIKLVHFPPANYVLYITHCRACGLKWALSVIFQLNQSLFHVIQTSNWCPK